MTSSVVATIVRQQRHGLVGDVVLVGGGGSDEEPDVDEENNYTYPPASRETNRGHYPSPPPPSPSNSVTNDTTSISTTTSTDDTVDLTCTVSTIITATTTSKFGQEDETDTNVNPTAAPAVQLTLHNLWLVLQLVTGSGGRKRRRTRECGFSSQHEVESEISALVSTPPVGSGSVVGVRLENAPIPPPMGDDNSEHSDAWSGSTV